MSTSNPFETTAGVASGPGQSGRDKRHIAIRILVSLLWFVPIFLVTNILVGGILGAFAGAGAADYSAGYAAGHRASQEFFQSYGLIFLAVQILGWLSLSVLGLLPGTGKFKRG